jgi:hypothetical protein
MNPFLAFLICVPLAVAFILDLVVIYCAIFLAGPVGEKIAAIIVLTAIATSLIYLLVRSSRAPLLDFAGSERVDAATRQSVTNLIVATMYVVLFGGALALGIIEHLRYWIGIGCAILGSLMLYSGIVHLKQARDLPRDWTPELITSYLARHEVLSPAHRKTRNWLIACFLITAIFAWPAFRFSQAEQYISVSDLLGILFLLASAVSWVILTGISLEKKVIVLRHHLESLGESP